MNISYLLYQAQRPRSAAEQREADTQAGELAAAMAGIGRAVKTAVNRHVAGNRLQEPVIPGDDLIPLTGSRR